MRAYSACSVAVHTEVINWPVTEMVPLYDDLWFSTVCVYTSDIPSLFLDDNWQVPSYSRGVYKCISFDIV